LVNLAEDLLEQGGYVSKREVIAIVAGTRTKSGSTNFLRLHVMVRSMMACGFLLPQRGDTSVAEPESRPLLRR